LAQFGEVETKLDSQSEGPLREWVIGLRENLQRGSAGAIGPKPSSSVRPAAATHARAKPNLMSALQKWLGANWNTLAAPSL